MIAALTLAVLYAISVTIVRVASVILRHTGLPDHVARLQSISAMSGAGFTTTESELIVNHPIRRRVITWLMIIGNLGIASVGATVIVTFVGKDGDAGRIAVQALTMLLVVGLTVFVVNNGALDRWTCALIAKLVAPTMGDDDAEGFDRLFLWENGQILARHAYVGEIPVRVSELLAGREAEPITILGIDTRSGNLMGDEMHDAIIHTGAEFLTFGTDAAHREFQARLRAIPVSPQEGIKASVDVKQS